MAKEKVSNDVLVERIDRYMEGIKGQLDGLHEKADKTNGNVKTNTTARIKMETTVEILKWAGGALAASDVIGLAVKLLAM
ncbi:MAG: hypothetical protein ACXABY_34860 [Candidatus Thorarchaeota archaeon]|jgi:hypothetical protein